MEGKCQGMWLSRDLTCSTTLWLGIELRLTPRAWRQENRSDSAPIGCVKEFKRNNYASRIAFNFFLNFLTFLNISFPVPLIISTKYFIIKIANIEKLKKKKAQWTPIRSPLDSVVLSFIFELEILFLGDSKYWMNIC